MTEGRVWIPFDDGTVAEVQVLVRENTHGQHRLVRTIGEQPPAMRKAQDRAHAAVGHWLERRQGSQLELIVHFELRDAGDGINNDGGSGGLAFAIAMAAERLQISLPDLVATGALDDNLSDRGVCAVDGVARKAAAAIEVLPSGGLFLYPAGNCDDLTEDMERELAERGIEVRQVLGLSDLLDRLFQSPSDAPPAVELTEPAAPPCVEPDRQRDSLRRRVAGFSLLAALSGGLYLGARSLPAPTPVPAPPAEPTPVESPRISPSVPGPATPPARVEGSSRLERDIARALEDRWFAGGGDELRARLRIIGLTFDGNQSRLALRLQPSDGRAPIDVSVIGRGSPETQVPAAVASLLDALNGVAAKSKTDESHGFD